MTQWRHILVEKKDGVGRIILNRPKLKNPLDRITTEETYEAMQQHLADDEVVVLEITGAGDAFCAGLLSGLLSQLGGPGPDDLRERLRGLSLAQVKRSVQRGNHLGALCCTDIGATAALPRYTAEAASAKK